MTFLEKGDAAAAMDNLHNAELYGKVLTCNYAQPVKIKGGEQGWASQPGAHFFWGFFLGLFRVFCREFFFGFVFFFGGVSVFEGLISTFAKTREKS